MPNNQITFGINFTSDSTQLKNIQQNLLAIKNMSAEIGQKLISSGQFKGTEAELEKIKTMAGQVSEVFEKTFNSTLGTANSLKVNQGLKEMGLSLSDVQTGFASLGTAGQFVFSQVRGGMAGLNYQLKEAHPLLKKIAEDFGKTFTWGIYSRVMNRIVGSIQTAYSFVQKLDTSLNNIRIVTGKSSEEMAKFAVQANKAAKSLGANTVDYTNASLIYYQQGLSDAEVRARTEVTVKVANITKQSADEVSEQLTAVWNGYRVSAEEAELYIDKLSAVAASTASDLEELSTAMSKVASAAATMGVDIDQLTAQISTIVSVTRQDAANVGTALKTIYARMGDLLVAGDAVDEFGVSLGDVSGQMAIMGINILDQQGNMRDLGTVIEEVAAKWETWTSAQQQAAAVALAGKRQYNNLIALFNNWDMYESALETSQTSEGTLQKQQDTYMESLEAHLEKLSAAGERLYNSLFDSDSFKSLLDVLTFLVDRVGDFVDAIGGGGQALQYLGSILVSVFSAQLSKNILAFANNLTVSRKNTEAYKNALNDLNQAQRAYQMGVGSAIAVDYHKDVLNDTKRAATFQMAARKGILNQDEAAALMGQETALQQSRQKVFAAQLTLENMGGSKEDQRTLKEALEAAKQGKLTEGQLARVQGIDFGQVTASAKDKYDSAVKKLMGANTLKKGEKWEGHISEDEFNKMSFESDEEAQEFKREWVDTSDNRNRYNASVYNTWKSQKKEISAAAKELTSLDQVSEATKNRITAALDAIQGKGKPTEDQMRKLNEAMKAGFTEAGAAGEKCANAVNNINKSTKELTEKEKAVQQQMLGQVFMQLASAATLAFQAIKSIISVLSDQNLSGVEKVKQIVMTLIGILPALIPIILGIKTSLKTLNMSLKELWGLVWPIALAIAALVAVIAVLIIAVDAIYKEQHKAQIAAEEAAKAYEEQKKALDDLKKSYDELKQSIEDYHDAQNAIDDLIVGTQEWKDAIKESNQQVIELLNKYSELAKYVSVGVGGRLTISEEGFEAIQDQEQAKIEQQTALTNFTAMRKARFELDANYEILRNKAGTGTWQEIAGNTGWVNKKGYLLTEKLYNDIIDNINNNVLKSNEDIENFIEEATNNEKKVVSSKDREALKDLAESLRENAEAVENNTTQMSLLQIELAKWFLQNAPEEVKTAYEQTQFKEAYEASAGKSISQEAIDKRVQEMKDSYSLGKHLPSTTIKNEKDIAFRYAKMHEAEGYTANGTVVYTKDKEKVLDFYYPSNKRDLAVKELAQYELAQEQANNLNYTEIEKRGTRLIEQGASSTVANYVLSQAEGRELDVGQLSSTYSEQLKKLTELDGELGKAAANVLARYDEEIRTIKRTTNNFIGDLLFGTKEEPSKFDPSLTLEQKKNISKVLENVYEFAGEDATAKQAAFLAQYTGTELDKIVAIFGQIDWSSRKAYNNFINSMKEANIEIKNQGNVFLNLINSLKSARSVIADFTSGWKDYKEEVLEIYDILGDLHPGDILDEEDFDRLRAWNVEFEKFVILTKEGYKFIGSSLDINKSTKDIYSTFNKLKQQFEEANKEVENFDDNFELTKEKNVADNDHFTNFDLARYLSKFSSNILQVAGISKEQLNNLLADYQEYSFVQSQNRFYTRDEKGNIKEITRETLLEALGYSEADAADLTDEQLRAEINNRYSDTLQSLQAFYNKVDEIRKQHYAGELNLTNDAYNQQVQLVLSQTGSLAALDELKKQFSSEELENYLDDFNKVEQSFILDEVERLGYSRDAWADWGKDNLKEQRKALKNLQAAAALDIANPVENITRALEEAKKELEDLQFIQETLTGDKLLNNLQEQLDKEKEVLNLQRQQSNLLEKQLVIRKQAFEEIEKSTEQALRNRGYEFNGSIYDENGSLNYSVLNQIIKTAQEANDETTIQDIEKLIEEQEKYTKSVEESADAVQAVQEEIRAVQDLKLQKFDLEIQIRLDKNQLRRDFYDAMKSFYEDNLPKAIGYTLSNMQTYVDQTGLNDFAQRIYEYNMANAALSGNETAKSYFSVNGQINEKEIEARRDEARNAIYEIMGDVKSAMDEAESLYLSGMQKVSEAFAEQISNYEHLQSIVEHDMNLINLLYGDSAFSQLQDLYNLKSNYIHEEYLLAEREAKVWMEQMDTLRDENGNITDQEAWDEANANFYAALEKRNSYLEAWIQSIKDKYLNSVYNAIDTYFRGLQSEESSTLFSTQWGIQNEQADRYYDTVNKTYEIRKLEAKYQDSIQNFTGNIKAQQQLNKLLQEQQKYLKEKDKLTKYDLDRANALYEVEVKRLQLEEARNRATQMQLVRDTEGNYRYQFVADQAEIDKAQQELNEAEANLWNIDKEQLRALGDEYLAVQKEYTEKIAQAANMADDEREKYVAAINKEYFGENGKLAALEANMKTLTQNVETDAKSIADSFNTDAETLLNELPNWERFNDLINGEGGISAGFDTLKNNIKSFFENMSNELPEYNKELEENLTKFNTYLTENKINNSIEDLKTIYGTFKDIFDLFNEFAKEGGPLQIAIEALKEAAEKIGNITNLQMPTEESKDETEEEEGSETMPPTVSKNEVLGSPSDNKFEAAVDSNLTEESLKNVLVGNGAESFLNQFGQNLPGWIEDGVQGFVNNIADGKIKSSNFNGGNLFNDNTTNFNINSVTVQSNNIQELGDDIIAASKQTIGIF